MSQWLRVCAALPEDVGSVPSTHACELTTTCKELSPLSSFSLTTHMHKYIAPQRAHIIKTS